MLHQISEVFVCGKAEPRRRPVDHGVHRIRERPPSRRHGDDHDNLDDFLGRCDREYGTERLRKPRVLRDR